VKQLGVIAQEQQQLNRLQYHDIVSKTFATAFKTYGIAQQRSPASPLPRYIWQDFRVQIPGTKLINIHVMVHGSLLVQIVDDISLPFGTCRSNSFVIFPFVQLLFRRIFSTV
jgi:hypothetical protein